MTGMLTSRVGAAHSLAVTAIPLSAKRSINSVAVEWISNTSGGGKRLNNPAGCRESVTTKTIVAGSLLWPALYSASPASPKSSPRR